MSAELSICAAPLAVKFYLLSAFFSIVPTSATASFGVKFHRRTQPVFNHAVRFVVKFYCRLHSVQSPFVYRITPAQNEARHRSSARLLPHLLRAANFKFNSRCFAPKFYSPRCKISIFYPKPPPARKTRAIKFTPPFAFVRPRYKRATFYRHRGDVF